MPILADYRDKKRRHYFGLGLTGLSCVDSALAYATPR